MPKENLSCKCLSLIMLVYVIRVNKKHYPQTLLEECKHEIKKTKMETLLMEIQTQVHLIMKLIMRLVMMNLMNNLLKVKTVF